VDKEITYSKFFLVIYNKNDNLITVTVFEFTLPLRQHHKFESNQGKLIQFSDLLHFAARHSIFIMKLCVCVCGVCVYVCVWCVCVFLSLCDSSPHIYPQFKSVPTMENVVDFGTEHYSYLLSNYTTQFV